jgi:hypothetical protein
MGFPLEDERITSNNAMKTLNTEEQKSFHFVTLLMPYILHCAMFKYKIYKDNRYITCYFVISVPLVVRDL